MSETAATLPETPDTADTATVEARRPEFPELDPHATARHGTPLDSIRDVPITITARLGHTTLPIGAILKLGPGSVVELDEEITTPVELTVRGVPFAAGEVIVVNDHFAVRITRLLAPRAGTTET